MTSHDASTIHVRVKKYGDRRNLVLYYRDPVTENVVTRSAGTTRRREAERAAAQWERELRSGQHVVDQRITWASFRQRYENEYLSGKAMGTFKSASTAMNHLERILNPRRLVTLTTSTISQLQGRMRNEGMKSTTIAAYLGHLRVALNWAYRQGLLARPVLFDMPRLGGGKLMRGRPITTEEFERMLAVAESVRPHDHQRWQYFLAGMWLSGLRLAESLMLSWDQHEPFCIDLSGRRPRFRIYAEGHKRRQDQLLPMTPDFCQFLENLPPEQRQGSVFGIRMTIKRAGRVVSAIGRRAGVVVNKQIDKFASAHDLRRAFASRWATQVKPVILQQLMRHSNIETTMKYYVDLDTDDICDQLWQHSGNISGNSCPKSPSLSGSQLPPAHEKTPAFTGACRAEGTGLEPPTPEGAPHFQ